MPDIGAALAVALLVLLDEVLLLLDDEHAPSTPASTMATARAASFFMIPQDGLHNPLRITHCQLVMPGRYQTVTGAIISALLTLREHVIAPLLAGTADRGSDGLPRHWTDIDRHYQVLCLEKMALFAGVAGPLVNPEGEP